MESNTGFYTKTSEADWQKINGTVPSANDLSTLNKFYDIITSTIEEEEWNLDSCEIWPIGEDLKANIIFTVNDEKREGRIIAKKEGVDNHVM